MANTNANLEKLDEGQKLRALQAALVQVIRGPVGCRNHHHASFKEHAKETAQNHRIYNVRDLGGC